MSNKPFNACDLTIKLNGKRACASTYIKGRHVYRRNFVTNVGPMHTVLQMHEIIEI